MKEVFLLKTLNKNLQNDMTQEFLKLLQKYRKKIEEEDTKEQLKAELYTFSVTLSRDESSRKTDS